VFAYPNQGYKFAGWTGDVAAGDVNENQFHVHMTKDLSIKANFVVNPAPKMYSVTFNATAGGTVSPSGTHQYEENAYVNVTAIPESNYKFVGWTGDWTDTANPTRMQVTRDNMVVTANFVKIQQNGIQLTQGLNGWITYNGSPGTPAQVFASLLSPVNCLPPFTPGATYYPIWDYSNGVYKLWLPDLDATEIALLKAYGSYLTYVNKGDLILLTVTRDCFWTWP
jgi:uncharacterized repeat protein (TIGR02543 family)